jgi:AcrR family transcriptional regulator
MTQRERQAAIRREQLLAAALTLFSEQGFHATTIADIANATGTAHGLIYHYFTSKEELVGAILDRYSFLPQLRQLLAVASGRPASEVLGEIAVGFSNMLSERRQLLRLVVRESQTNETVARALADLMDQGNQALTGYLEARIDASELRPHDPTVVARALFWSIVVMHLTEGAVPRFERDLVEVLLHGILARPQPT